ncbi:MAG TPA: PqiC family protein [Rickettsiales bacterium]|nr:PqiC family protein [Rickettsiales bacterium]
MILNKTFTHKLNYLFVLLLLSSCIGGISIPANFYNLTPTDNSNIKIKNKKNITINIEYVVIPTYLDKIQITTLNGSDTELDISEINRLAEPLSDSIPRILAQDMYSYMPNTIIKYGAMKNGDADYYIHIVINRFDGRFNDKLILNTWWSILDKNGNTVFVKNSNFETDLEGNYNNLVKKYSELINRLAIEISDKI